MISQRSKLVEPLGIGQETEIYKPESVREDKIHKTLWNYKIQTDHLIKTGRPAIVLIKKGTCHLVDFGMPVDHSKREGKKINKYGDHARELKRQ